MQAAQQAIQDIHDQYNNAVMNGQRSYVSNANEQETVNLSS